MAKKVTTENNIKEKLEYLNLDLNKVPDFLKKYEPLDFRISNGINDTEQIVFKYIPINKIQILITPNTRNADLRVKYNESLPLHRYAVMQGDEDFEKYTIFLNMLNSMSIDGIKEIEDMQSKLDKNIPYRVRYNKSYLWQIYYSQVADTYFMLVPIDDMEYEHMFYLLKKQIEFANSRKRIAPKIYVPINYLDYSRDIYSIAELKDVENYLWLLAGDWVNTYEVYDKKDKPSIHMIGKAKVYDNIKTEYKVKLSDRDEALDFYKLTKALFILKTELNQFYKFDVRIDENSELEFYYNSEKITLETLPIFINREYKKISDELVRKNLSANKLVKVLSNMKEDCFKKEGEFFEKERQISTFLEYKKTFLGKIKIFFSSKKKKKEEKIEHIEITEKEEKIDNADVLEQIIQTKSSYTIEDLMIVYSLYDKKLKYIKDLEMDIDALEHKLKNLERKIENATLYIKEIENHKKSIFEFWKFANKDELPALSQGETVISKKKLSKVFNYEFDFEDFGSKIDKIQRKKLTKDEINSIFLAKTNVLLGINLSRKEELNNAEKKAFKKLLDSLKKELKEENAGVKDFDIFGSVTEDRTQVKVMANKHHRENEKNKLQILNINDSTTMEEFLEILKEIDNNIKTAFSKVNFTYNMPIYKTMPTNDESDNNLNIFSMNVLSAMKENDSDEVNLFKINVNEGQNAVFYSNIIFYDNTNQTLPVGMNLSDDVLLDINGIELKLVEKKKFLTNLYIDNKEDCTTPNVLTVNLFEYIAQKDEKS